VNVPGNSTAFFDTTLQLFGLQASAPLVTTPIVPGLTVLSQALGTGTFKLWSTDNDGLGLGSPKLLLEGTINSAVISGVSGASTGGVFSASVTYYDGIIYDAISGGAPSLQGELSWSLLNASPTLTGGPTYLNGFQADASGLFNVVIPEPTCLPAVALVAGLVMRRRSYRTAR
jgi:hypothetical protein